MFVLSSITRLAIVLTEREGGSVSVSRKKKKKIIGSKKKGSCCVMYNNITLALSDSMCL